MLGGKIKSRETGKKLLQLTDKKIVVTYILWWGDKKWLYTPYTHNHVCQIHQDLLMDWMWAVKERGIENDSRGFFLTWMELPITELGKAVVGADVGGRIRMW